MGKLILAFLGMISLVFILRSPENVEAALTQMGLSTFSALMLLCAAGLVAIALGARTPNGRR